MFGYVTVNRPELKVKELELYRSYYCGLCAELHRRYGRKGQLLLSYDCTFLLILLTGTYEPEETQKLSRCIVHPAIVHRETSNRFTEYAADMNVLLAWLKAADDWGDERSRSAKLLTMLLRRDYLKIREKYPRQEKAVRENIRALHREEERALRRRKAAGSTGKAPGGKLDSILARIDRTAGYTGRFLAQLCAPEEDRWAEDLGGTGFYLGKFIYLIDAYDDLEKDRKSGNYNVLLELERAVPESFENYVKEILLDTAACCCRRFERLPIVKDVELLRNILYSGIWMRFRQIRSGEENEKKIPLFCDRMYR
jgi:hypothetical protein